MTENHDHDSCDPAPMRSLVKQELERIAERWKEADARFLAARQRALGGEWREAELDREDARGEWFGCSRELSDLFFMLARHALRHDREGLRQVLVEVLRPELEELWDEIARGRSWRRA